jgi:soluble lytic murein transglycosylase-like protein
MGNHSAMRRTLLAKAFTLLLPIPTAIAAAPRPQPIPEGYVRVGTEQGVPPAVVFGVALQESRLLFGTKFGKRALPWPWTLNVAGAPYRFTTRIEAENALRRFLSRGISSIDIGPMQVNWRYNKNRLITESHALDPYWNLRVGATILREHFVATDNWFSAVGRYHSPSNRERATKYAHSVWRHIARLANA